MNNVTFNKNYVTHFRSRVRNLVFLKSTGHMKKNFDTMNLPGRQQHRYSGLEPVYSQEFIESEENEENNFYSFTGEDLKDSGEENRRMMNS